MTLGILEADSISNIDCDRSWKKADTVGDFDAHEVRPLDSLSPDERKRLLIQLNRVVARAIEELAVDGRIDLIEPLHNLSTLLRVVSAEIASSDGFAEVVASVAQLLRTIRNVRSTRKINGSFH